MAVLSLSTPYCVDIATVVTLDTTCEGLLVPCTHGCLAPWVAWPVKQESGQGSTHRLNHYSLLASLHPLKRKERMGSKIIFLAPLEHMQITWQQLITEIKAGHISSSHESRHFGNWAYAALFLSDRVTRRIGSANRGRRQNPC